MLNNFMNLPESCVFLIKNEQKKIVYINYTNNIALALARFYTDFKNYPDKNNFQLQVLSVTTDIETLKIHTEYWRDMYRNMEYGNLVDIKRKAIQYKVRIIPSVNLSWVDVELVAARGSSKIVGRFKTYQEAEEFVNMYYGDNNLYCLPVYALNSLTKELVNENRKTKISI